MNHTSGKAGRSQLLIWKAETGWLTSLYEKDIPACWNNPGRINFIEQPACWDVIQMKVAVDISLSVSGLKLRGSRAGFIKVSFAQKNKKEKAV